MSDKCLLATDFFSFFYHFYSQFNETTLDFSTYFFCSTHIYIKNWISLILNLSRWQINSSLNCEENKQTEELMAAAIVVLGDGGDMVGKNSRFLLFLHHWHTYNSISMGLLSLLWWYLDIHSYKVIEKINNKAGVEKKITVVCICSLYMTLQFLFFIIFLFLNVSVSFSLTHTHRYHYLCFLVHGLLNIIMQLFTT